MATQAPIMSAAIPANLVTINNEQTMSSREIAELTGKQHAHVIRDIRVMLDALKDDPNLDHGDDADLRHVEEIKDQRGYTSEIKLNYDLTMTLISGYSITLRHRIVKRWKEYETGARDPMSALNNPETLRHLLLGYTEKVTALESKVEEMTPTVQAFDRIAKSDGSLCITDAAKTLQMRPKDLTDWLQANGWIYKRVGKKGWLAYQPKIQQGLLEHKGYSFTRADGTEGFDERVRITPKGLAKLAQLLSGGRA